MTVSGQAPRAKQRAHRTRCVVVALVALGLALHFSCWPLGRRIPFESVGSGFHSQAEGCELFLPAKYGIVIGTTPDEVTEIARCVPVYDSPVPQPLSQIEVSRQFVLVAMAKWNSIGPPSPPADILRICQRGNRVIVTARLSPSPWPFQKRAHAIAYPHHVVVIDRSALKKGGELEFVLVDRLGLSLASVRHTVMVEP